jgi:hypothetical protein
MNRKLTIMILIVAALLLTSCMTASFSGNYALQEGKILRGDLFVTSGSVTLEENSRVTGTIMMTSGELHIGKDAQVGKDVVLTSGALYLDDGAVVHGDVILASTEIKVHQSQQATVMGNITTNIAPFAITTLLQGSLLYCVVPIVVLVVVILGLGNWLGRRSKKGRQMAQSPAMAASEDTKTKLQNLKEMLDASLITPTDYEAKKADILSKI